MYGNASDGFRRYQYALGPGPALGEHLASIGSGIDLGADALGHAEDLATLIGPLRGGAAPIPPLGVLMRLLLHARSFVHLTTFGLDLFTLGVLETAAQRVRICGVVNGLDSKMRSALEPSKEEAPRLELRVGSERGDPGDQNHGKLLVVDGILAITGSANLTHKGWRKAAANMEIIDVVTETTRVAELNNQYFSPHWRALGTDLEKPIWHVSGWTHLPPRDADDDDERKES